MDPGRYGAHQIWEHNSALDGYDAEHEPRYRVGSSYGDRRNNDERIPRDNMYTRSSFRREILDREPCPPAQHSANRWPSSRRRIYEDEYPCERDSRREETPHFDTYDDMDTFDEIDYYSDNEFDRYDRPHVRDRNEFRLDDFYRRPRIIHQNREDSREKEYGYDRRSYDSDSERTARRESNWRRNSRDRDCDGRLSQEKYRSPRGRRDRSLSRCHDDRSRSRSGGRSHSYSHQDDNYDDSHYERGERRKDREEKLHRDHFSSAPSATVVVKGLSHKTTEEDLYQFLAEWGPLRHVRVIKERSSGFSRGFAFIDFPSVGSARSMMDIVGDDGILADGRKLVFEYSSKTTGAATANYGQENLTRSNTISHKSIALPSDWMCIICKCVNFARRTSCFQCNEVRTEDAPAAEVDSNSTPGGRKCLETGPSHVLVVRGLDDNSDEEILRYEFSKHAPLKDIRLVRDKFTHVSRGFAFVHFYTIDDATKALEATNGTALEKNGQTLRVSFAKSILGPGSSAFGSLQSSSLAAAAIEAATFSQQYDSVGWTPKEYNPDEKHSIGSKVSDSRQSLQQTASVPQSGFVWDEASGYYYDAASGFYYDGTTGLYYDGNSGTWYSYDNQTQQYVPCPSDNNETKTSEKIDSGKTTDGSTSKKVVISAPASTIKPSAKSASLPDAVEAAAAAAIAAEKKEKEKSKEIRLSSKTSILANKKKMNNVLTKWKQRNHEGQAPRIALDDDQMPPSDNRAVSFALNSAKPKPKPDTGFTKESAASNPGHVRSDGVGCQPPESGVKPRPVSNSLGGTVMGVIRGSGRGVIRSDTLYSGSQVGSASLSPSPSPPSPAIAMASSALPSTVGVRPCATPFLTDVSALGSYAPGSSSSSTRRRFSEAPQLHGSYPKEQSHAVYRDRAAERRTLYRSSSSVGGDLSDVGTDDSNRDLPSKKGSYDSMPFPPGVGGRAGEEPCNSPSYEVIGDDKAIGERNVGSRMLRSMGWQEGSGLGKDGGGMVEPVKAMAVEKRAGLGNHQQKRVEPWMEVNVGDSYRTVIHKKAQARFREMSSS